MIAVQRITSREQLEAAFRIRMKVFVEEQKVPAEVEVDEYEDICDHVLVFYNGEPAGTGRMRRVEDMAKIERVCVLQRFRKYGLGAAVMNELEQIAVEKGLRKAKLHAQTQAAGFYEKLGYRTDSDVFMEESIPHVRMVKDLA